MQHVKTIELQLNNKSKLLMTVQIIDSSMQGQRGTIN